MSGDNLFAWMRETTRGAGPSAWSVKALAIVRDVAASRATFTTDDVWPQLEANGDPRAMGPVMLDAVKLGYCVATDTTRKSTRAACNRRPIRIWRSLLHKGT